MISIEDIEIFLPKYLSTESKKILFEELKSFPDNIDKRIYTNNLVNTEVIYQGDGLCDLLMINLPDAQIRSGKGVILSNTCDINPENERYFPSRISYSPIINLEKYSNALFEEGVYTHQQLENHINSIKKQHITQIFFLPASGNLEHDSIVFFDRIVNCDNEIIERTELSSRRIFSLSDYGLYLFLFKLSFHFTRIQEGIERGHD